MIRSGLANVQKAGYLGYPHERDKNPRNDVERPFVSIGDETVLKKSDLSDPLTNPVTVPAPIMYNDIFAKRTTPDERVYVLKQIQQGLEKIQKGLLGKESKQAPQLPLPSQTVNGPFPPGGPVNQPGGPPGGPVNQPGGPTGGADPGADGGAGPTGGSGPNTGFPGVSGSPPALIGESPITAEDTLELGEEAQDVVANPPPAPSVSSQEERAFNEWLHMQHSHQWRQIEGRTFNSASSYHTASSGTSTDYGTVSSYRGPDSSGSYPTPSPRYPTLPSLYPDLAMTPDSPALTRTQRMTANARDAYLQMLAVPETPSTTMSGRTAVIDSPNILAALDFINSELSSLNLEAQRNYLLNLSLEQRQNIAQAVIDNPTHPISRLRVIQTEIPLFSPGTAGGQTPLNSSGYLTAGTSNSFSSVTPSPISVASAISSNGVGPRRRSIGPRSADSRMSVPMSVDSPPPRRRFSRENAPPPIDTNVQRPVDIQPRRRNVNRRTDTFIPDQSRMLTRRNNQ